MRAISTIFLFVFVLILMYVAILHPAFFVVPLMPSRVSESELVPILSVAESAEMVERINSLSEYWCPEVGGHFYTLGVPSYLGGLKKGRVSNEFILDHFGDLLEKVRSYFETAYPDRTVVLGGGDAAPDAGVPGFHIFHPTFGTKLPVASLHVDSQFYDAGFTRSRRVPYDSAISFTLLLESPESGAGLHLWNASSFDYREHGVKLVASPLNLIAHRDTYSYIPYRVGKMAIHNGNHYHLIAPFACGDTRSRVTLQGHGFFDQNTLYLYW